MIGRDFLYSIHKDKKSIYFVKIKASFVGGKIKCNHRKIK